MSSMRTSFARRHTGTANVMAATSRRCTAAPRVAVVGGGMAGAAAAKYLRLWSAGQIAVTLIEKEPRYTSNVLSNHVLTGQRSLSSLYFSHVNLVSRYGVRVVRADVTSIVPGSAPGTWRVATGAGASLAECDRVVLAPGVQFDPVPSLHDPDKPADVLHAWQAGPQTELLRQRIVAMPAKGTVLIAIPARPYRCVSAPYERACLVAEVLLRNKPGAKVLVLDANGEVPAEAVAFVEGLADRYRATIEHRPGVAVTAVDAASGTVRTAGGELLRAEVLNVIPSQRAGAIVQTLGIADPASGNFARVESRSFEAQQLPGIHVIGDAADSGMPKAATAGIVSAKRCARAIAEALGLRGSGLAPVADNVCYLPVVPGRCMPEPALAGAEQFRALMADTFA